MVGMTGDRDGGQVFEETAKVKMDLPQVSNKPIEL